MPMLAAGYARKSRARFALASRAQIKHVLARQTSGLGLVATVLDDAAEPLATAAVSPRTALVFGNEAHGLADDWSRLCQRRVTIPMQRGTDSLNVAVAAGIFLYHFTKQEPGACR